MALLKTNAMLKRFVAATGGDVTYPTKKCTEEVAALLQEKDPELLSLIVGDAPAALELAAIENTLPDLAPSEAERIFAAEASRADRLAMLTPFGLPAFLGSDGVLVEATEGDPIAAAELESLDPARAAALREGVAAATYAAKQAAGL